MLGLVTSRTLSRWESGESRPSAFYVAVLAAIFRVRIDAFCTPPITGESPSQVARRASLPARCAREADPER